MFTNKRIIIALVIVLFGYTFSYYQNYALETTKMKVTSTDLQGGW
ncbi:hypothetical protein [Halobacillus mangrovi]|nr:hypothetical protein [Halobacillus mangrovi]